MKEENMNGTKWNEIFKAFWDLECNNPMDIHWKTKSVKSGFEYEDSTWSHFGCEPTNYKDIEWLKIKLTDENRNIVISVLRKIHVPGEIQSDNIIIYGYKQQGVDYI